MIVKVNTYHHIKDLLNESKEKNEIKFENGEWVLKVINNNVSYCKYIPSGGYIIFSTNEYNSFVDLVNNTKFEFDFPRFKRI